MKAKPYKAKSLSGAQTYVRMLLKQREDAHRLLDKFDADRKALRGLLGDALHALSLSDVCQDEIDVIAGRIREALGTKP